MNPAFFINASFVAACPYACVGVALLYIKSLFSFYFSV